MKEKHASYLILFGILLIGIAAFFYLKNESVYLKAARSGGDYLIAHMHTDGSFVYRYNPVTKKESSTYNIVRHAGTTYSLLELFEATGEQKYLRAAQSALAYLAQNAIPCPGIPEALCIEENNETKLGSNALAVLAFSKYVTIITPEADTLGYLPLAQKLARFMVHTQAPSGEFMVHKISVDSGDETAFESEYYPGEAIFALARLYALDKNPQWIDAAHRGAHWLIEVRDAHVSTVNLNHDHWLLYALNELYAHRPDELYLTHAQKIVQSIAAAQHTNETGDRKDWNGGFYDPPRSTPTATRCEGLGAAYRLFTQSGDGAYAFVALTTMKKAADFQLRTQFTAQKLRELNGDMSAVGGFHESLDDYTVRIDYVQHNISALLALDAALKENKSR